MIELFKESGVALLHPDYLHDLVSRALCRVGIEILRQGGASIKRTSDLSVYSRQGSLHLRLHRPADAFLHRLSCSATVAL